MDNSVVCGWLLAAGKPEHTLNDEEQRHTFMALLQLLVTQNNELSRAPSEATGR